VTVAQYECFVEAGGYGQEQWWPEAHTAGFWEKGKVKSRYRDEEGDHKEWREAPDNSGDVYRCANHPVVDVNWFEAVAFCHWLSKASRLPDHATHRGTMGAGGTAYGRAGLSVGQIKRKRGSDAI